MKFCTNKNDLKSCTRKMRTNVAVRIILWDHFRDTILCIEIVLGISEGLNGKLYVTNEKLSRDFRLALFDRHLIGKQKQIHFKGKMKSRQIINFFSPFLSTDTLSLKFLV